MRLIDNLTTHRDFFNQRNGRVLWCLFSTAGIILQMFLLTNTRILERTFLRNIKKPPMYVPTTTSITTTTTRYLYRTDLRQWDVRGDCDRLTRFIKTFVRRPVKYFGQKSSISGRAKYGNYSSGHLVRNLCFPWAQSSIFEQQSFIFPSRC